MKNATDAMKEARVPDILNLVSRICFLIFMYLYFFKLQPFAPNLSCTMSWLIHVINLKQVGWYKGPLWAHKGKGPLWAHKGKGATVMN